MSLINTLLGGPAPAQATPPQQQQATPPQQQQQQQQQQPPGQNPPQAQNPPGTPPQSQTPYDPAQPTPQQQQGFPNAQAAPNPNDPLNIGALLYKQPDGSPPQQDPAQTFATNLVQSVVGQQTGPQSNDALPPQVQPEAFASMMEQADFTQGIDFAALVQEIQTGENPQEAMKNAFQAIAKQTMFSMVPLLNQMAEAVHTGSITQAMQQMHQGSRSEQIISAFGNKFDYASNPVVSGLLGPLAQSLASKAPPDVSPADLANALHEMFGNMSGNIANATAPNQPGSAAAVTTDFSKLF